jgi:NADPH:quinone reductase-like Zn-dependent oxidoreductase
MADFFGTAFAKNWPTRIMGINKIATGTTNKINRELGFTNQASLICGTGAAGIVVTAGADVRGLAGGNMTVTITTGGGALAVTSNGLDIAIVQASGASHAAAVVTAFNAAIPAAFATAALIAGSAGGTNMANLSKTYLTSNQRIP